MIHTEIKQLTTIHASFTDPLRIRIVRLLMEREFCVCELVRLLNEPQYKVSRHLGILKRAGLVDDWREGTWMHYQIAPTLTQEWHAVLVALCPIWDQSTEIQADRTRLRQQSIREPGEPLTCSII